MKKGIIIQVIVLIIAFIVSPLCQGKNLVLKKDTGKEILISYDRGKTWQPESKDKTQHLIRIVNGKSYESLDRGVTWKPIAKGAKNYHIILQKPNGTFVSYDRGVTWETQTMENSFNVEVYPNPASEYCFIDFKNNTAQIGFQITVTDSKGSTLFNTYCNDSFIKLDTRLYAPGLYLITITGGSVNCRKSFVVY